MGQINSCLVCRHFLALIVVKSQAVIALTQLIEVFYMHPTGCDGKEDHKVSEEGVPMKIVNLDLVTGDLVESEF